jgi:DNA transposition AAA+ family ATPase
MPGAAPSKAAGGVASAESGLLSRPANPSPRGERAAAGTTSFTLSFDKRYQAKERAVSDPTTLILVDEADPLQMNSLEQMRSIFDEGTAGMVLIGMPGIEKRVARFPQFYSRIGFVHEFRPLDGEQIQALLESRWAPAGVKLPDEQLLPDVIASLIRMTGGNFRLLARLLTQIERVLTVNDLNLVSTAVVEAARDSLVIGPG